MEKDRSWLNPFWKPQNRLKQLVSCRQSCLTSITNAWLRSHHSSVDHWLIPLQCILNLCALNTHKIIYGVFCSCFNHLGRYRAGHNQLHVYNVTSGGWKDRRAYDMIKLERHLPWVVLNRLSNLYTTGNNRAQLYSHNMMRSPRFTSIYFIRNIRVSVDDDRQQSSERDVQQNPSNFLILIHKNHNLIKFSSIFFCII